MTLKLSPETWAQVRYEYEYTDKPVDQICFDYRVSGTTLRDRVRRWGWTPRNEPVPAEGPPAMLPVQHAAPLVPALTPADALVPGDPAAGVPVPIASTTTTPEGAAALPAPHAALNEAPPPDPAEIVPRLQGAVARMLPAIEATIAKLAAGPMHPREMERAVRTFTALTRTLRELNELLSQYPAPPPNRGPKDPDEFALMLLRRLEAFKARCAEEKAGGERPVEGSSGAEREG